MTVRGATPGARNQRDSQCEVAQRYGDITFAAPTSH